MRHIRLCCNYGKQAKEQLQVIDAILSGSLLSTFIEKKAEGRNCF